MICDHALKYVSDVSMYACIVLCETCNKKYIVKPKNEISFDAMPIAANEYISYKLLMLLKSKGINIDVPQMELLTKEKSQKILNINHPTVIIEHIGEHLRISEANLNHKSIIDLKMPDWLYWFDKWIGRLDSNGDSNLLLDIKNQKVYPVDYTMSYHWACGEAERVIKMNFFDVRCFERVKNDSSDNTKNIIKSLTDDEIYNVLFDDNEIIYPEFITRNSLVSYYTGLIFRKNIM